MLTVHTRLCFRKNAPNFGIRKQKSHNFAVFRSAPHHHLFRYHHIFLKSVIDYHQLGRNRPLVSSQAVTQPRNAPVSASDAASHTASIEHAAHVTQSHAHARPSSAPSGSNGYSSLLLSRAIGEQDAAVRLRAAAEWLDASSGATSFYDLPAEVITEDDLPLVQPPQHLLPSGAPHAMDSRPPAAQGRFSSKDMGALSHANMENRRQVSQPSIGQKRPAPNAIGSSASNAIVIDDD